MAHNPYLAPETASLLYSTAQSLSGIAPTGPTGPVLSGPTGPLSFSPPQYYSYTRPEPEPNEEKKKGVQAVNPVIFDILASSEVNGRLKRSFGIAFIVITCLFTFVSYAIIIFASIYEWKIPAAAFTALVIQAPLQMIGILYVMAKHLYPTATVETAGKKNG
jgi:hypothetical protein